MTTFGLLVFGAAVGLLGGLLGIGGGVVLVPGLMILFGFTQPEAQGTSLAVLSLPVAVFAALVYYDHGYVRLPAVAAIVAGFAVGAFAGASLVPHVPPAGLRVAFGVLLLYLGFGFVFNTHAARPLAALPAGVAAVITAIVAWVFRRRRPPPESMPPEYHI